MRERKSREIITKMALSITIDAFFFLRDKRERKGERLKNCNNEDYETRDNIEEGQELSKGREGEMSRK